MRYPKKVKIGLADNQSILRCGLKSILEYNNENNFIVEWQVSSGEELIDQIHKNHIDILIMDICLKDMDGIDLLSELKENHPDTTILILTQYSQSKFIKTSFLEGADGYILKSDTERNLIKAIRTVLNGETFMGEGISIGPKRTKVSPHDKKKWASEDAFLLKHDLTTREKEVLIEICSGKTNKEIAKELFISDQTVSVHRKNIMRKFNVNSTKTLKKVARKFDLQDALPAV